MAKEKKVEKVLERTYVVPLRQSWLKVPRHRRAKRAINALKDFLAKHMKVEDRDRDKIKLDNWVNRAIWSRGIKNVPYKISVKATKDSDGIVKVELVSLPPSFKSEDAFLKKKMEKSRKKAEEKSKEKEKKAEKKPEEKKEEPKSEEEKLEEEKKKEEEKELHKEIRHEKQHVGHEVKSHVKTEVHKTNTKK